MRRQPLLRAAALVGPGVIAVTFETVRHAYLDSFLTEAQGNVLTGALVIAASALFLIHIFRRLERGEAEARRAQARQAVHEERERIAADLHDDVGQSLFYLNVKLNEVQRLLEGGGEGAAEFDGPVEPGGAIAVALTRIDHMRGALQQLDERLRTTISELKSAGQSDGLPFTEVVRNHLDRFEGRTGIPVAVGELSHRCGPDCPGAEQELLRMLQEALVNVSRHAGASRVRVTVRSDAERDVLVVQDDGRGFDPEAAPGVDEGHFGLTLLRERAAGLGGTLTVNSGPGRGTAIRFERIHRPGDVAAYRPGGKRAPLGDELR